MFRKSLEINCKGAFENILEWTKVAFEKLLEQTKGAFEKILEITNIENLTENTYDRKIDI